MIKTLVLCGILASVASVSAAVAQDEDGVAPLQLQRVGVAKELAAGRQLGDTPPLLMPLRSTENANGVRLWRLDSTYEYLYEPSCELITVPENFVTDLASIPSIIRVRHNPADYAEAALVHDWLYAVGLEGQREKADKVFRELLLETGHQENIAAEIYRSVRIGGNGGYGLSDDFRFYSVMGRQVYQEQEKPLIVFKEFNCDPQASQ